MNRILILTGLLFLSSFLYSQKHKNTKDNIVDYPDSVIFTVTPIMPEFRYKNYETTIESLEYFFKDSIRYPSSSCKGKVYVTFIVEPNGSLSRFGILLGIDKCSGYAEEANRLIMSMPKWTSGQIHNKKVRVQYNVVIDFGATSK